MFLDFRTMVSLIFLLAWDVSGFCSPLCGFFFFFAAVTVCLTNFGLLALVPSKTQNNSFLLCQQCQSTTFMIAFCSCFRWIEQFPLFTRSLHLFSFTPTHHTLPDSWIFKCIISRSFMCFLFSCIIRSLDHGLYLFLCICHIISLMLVQVQRCLSYK